MHTLKEDNLKSHQLLDQWANKDTLKVKPKKSKKSLEWNSMNNKHQIGGANKAVLEKTLASAKLNQKNPIRTQNSNKIDQPSITRENTIAKKTPPLSVEAQPASKQKFQQYQQDEQGQQKANENKQAPQQKDSINSISSSVTSGSVNNTMTTTSSEASSSRSNSGNNGRPPLTQTVLETSKKNSVRPTDKIGPSAPPPPPATTINPPAKTDFNPVVVKKNSVN